MSIEESIIKSLEPAIEKMLEKHDEDRMKAFTELFDTYEQSILNGVALIQKADDINRAAELYEKVMSAKSKDEESENIDEENTPAENIDEESENIDEENTPAENQTLVQSITTIKSNTNKILGTVTELKATLEQSNSTVIKAVEKTNKDLAEDSKEKQKDLEKLQKTAKATLDRTSKTKKFFKNLGKFILGGAIFFLFGDLIKDLVVSGFDKFIHSDFAKGIKVKIDEWWPGLGKAMTQLGDWWTKKAKPWLDNPDHSIAAMFSRIFDNLANIYEGVVRILKRFNILPPDQSSNAFSDIQKNEERLSKGKIPMNVDLSLYSEISPEDQEKIKAQIKKDHPEYTQNQIDRALWKIIADETSFKDKYPNIMSEYGGVKLHVPKWNVFMHTEMPDYAYQTYGSGDNRRGLLYGSERVNQLLNDQSFSLPSKPYTWNQFFSEGLYKEVESPYKNQGERDAATSRFLNIRSSDDWSYGYHVNNKNQEQKSENRPSPLAPEPSPYVITIQNFVNQQQPVFNAWGSAQQ